jgi:hypothetical protein
MGPTSQKIIGKEVLSPLQGTFMNVAIDPKDHNLRAGVTRLESLSQGLRKTSVSSLASLQTRLLYRAVSVDYHPVKGVLSE